jgi:hypothetical protein
VTSFFRAHPNIVRIESGPHYVAASENNFYTSRIAGAVQSDVLVVWAWRGAPGAQIIVSVWPAVVKEA